MKLVNKPLKTSALVVALSFILTACGQPETLRTVSDFCLNSRVISLAVAPGEGVDDPGNQFDTDETVAGVLANNKAIFDVCGR